MNELRDNCNQEELEAHRILDAVRLGIDVPSETITRALWITGDAVGLYSQSHSFMKPLHINEPRCAGRDVKQTSNICPRRDDCARHKQMAIDREMGLGGQKNIKVYSLPFVKGLECNYFLPASK